MKGVSMYKELPRLDHLYFQLLFILDKNVDYRIQDFTGSGDIPGYVHKPS